MKVNRGISVKETTKRYVRVMNDATARISTLDELKAVPASAEIYELGPRVQVVVRVEAVRAES